MIRGIHYFSMDLKKRKLMSSQGAALKFDQAKTQQLINAETSNLRDFWKLLRGRRPTNSHCLDVNDFYTYFKKLGNPADVHFIADEVVF